MPILTDIMDHQVLGPAIRQGRAEGLMEGRAEGRNEGQGEIVRQLLVKRFGPIPTWVENRLSSLSENEFGAVAVRLLDAKQIEDLFPR